MLLFLPPKKEPPYDFKIGSILEKNKFTNVFIWCSRKFLKILVRLRPLKRFLLKSTESFKKIVFFIFGPRDLKFGEKFLQDDPITLPKGLVRDFSLTLWILVLKNTSEASFCGGSTFFHFLRLQFVVLG